MLRKKERRIRWKPDASAFDNRYYLILVQQRGYLMRAAALRNGMVGLLLSGLLVSAAQARTLDTAYGEVEVTGTPERVVTLYEARWMLRLPQVSRHWVR